MNIRPTNTPAASSSCTDPVSQKTQTTGQLGNHSIQPVEHQASPTIASQLSNALHEFLGNLQPHPPTPIPTPESTPESTPPPSPQRSRTNSLNSNSLNSFSDDGVTTHESSPSSPTTVEPSEDGVALSPSLSVASLGDGEDDDPNLNPADELYESYWTDVHTPQRSRANSLDSADTSSPLNKLETFIAEQKLTTEDAETLRQGEMVSHVTFKPNDYSAQFTFHQLIETDPASLAAAVFNPANGTHFIPRCETVDKIKSNNNTTSAEYSIKGPKIFGIRTNPYILNLKNELTPLENQDSYKVVSTLQQQPGSESSLLKNFTTSLEVQDGSISDLASKSLVTYKGNLQLQPTVGFLVQTALGKDTAHTLQSKLTEVFTKQTDLAELPVTQESSLLLFNTAIQAMMDKG